MALLTEEGRQIVNGLAQQHGFSYEATEHMFFAVARANGTMAQFNHYEFGGAGQWMRGGMTMIGDMFNNYLKGRVDGLCSAISAVLHERGSLTQSGSFQSQSQSGSGFQHQETGGHRSDSTLFTPDPSQNWWPQELGYPNASGSQNQTQYAYFAGPCRLAVKTGLSVWVYDTQNHQIGGFAQQQSGSGSITFTSQYGNVDLSSLPVVMRDGEAIMATTTPAPLANDYSSAPVPAPRTSNDSSFDVFAAIEKLGDLRAKGFLTDDEFNTKKQELLSRL